MTHGSPSIAGAAGRWNDRDAERYLTAVAVGAIAGVAAAGARTPLHLPGHKALLWMTPVLACRLLGGTRGAAIVGATSALAAATAAGGHLAGATAWAWPAVALAGAALDWTATSRAARTAWRWPAFAVAGAAGNLVCAAGHLAGPVAMGPLGGWSHAAFGAIAGLAGTAVADAARRSWAGGDALG